MLKTPRFPVWVCSINSSCSVLFSATRSLLSDWRAEHLFQLYYYSGQSSQRAMARLTVGERCGRTSAGLTGIPLVLHPPSVSCFLYRYSLPPLGGVVQRWRRRSRETVSLTGDDHQDQVGRSCDRLEWHLPLLLNITTNTSLRSSQHSRLFLPLQETRC